MDAVTHPHPEVSRLLATDFVCATVDTKAPGDAGRRALHRLRIAWEPAFVFLDRGGRELRRFVGYRPPDEFTAELQITRGLYDMQRGDSAGAEARFRAVGRRTEIELSDLAAEATFWRGVAAFRQSRDKQTLHEVWSEIEQRWPDSSWWRRADVFDATPTGVRSHMRFHPEENRQS